MTKGLHYFFIDALEKYADNVAIVTPTSSLTYKAIDILSNQLANQLLKAGVQENDIVALSLTDGIWQIVAILAILKINATYLPVNQDTPSSRLNVMLEIARCRYLITDSLKQEVR